MNITGKTKKILGNLAALVFGVFLALLLLLGAEFCAWIYLKTQSSKIIGPWEHYYLSDQLSMADPALGFKARPNAAVSVQRRRGDSIAYSVTWHTDDHGRRITPTEGADLREQAALFFGCSFTFGEGVEDAQTLPALFGAAASQYLPYNYGYMGYGPQGMFLQLDQDTLFDDIAKPVGLIVYTYIPDHVNRLIGRMRLVTKWAGVLPCLEETNEGIQCLGSFESSGLWRQHFYNIAAMSSLLKAFRIDFPVNITSKHYSFFADVLNASAAKAKHRFPQARHIVLMYPRETSGLEAGRVFTESGLEVLQLEGQVPDDFALGPKYNLPDRHPTAASYKFVVEALVKYLRTTK